MKKLITIINYLLIVVAILGSLYEVITRDTEIGLILKDISIILTITSPYWIEKLIHKRIDNVIKLILILFIFCAHFLGATMELYNSIPYYDKFTHTLSGVLTGLIALLFLHEINLDKNKIFNIIFVIFATLGIAACWEFFEYFANIFFGGDAQRVVLTGVNDTMQDMLVAFLGSIIVIIFYFIEVLKNKIGFVNKFMNGIKDR